MAVVIVATGAAFPVATDTTGAAYPVVVIAVIIVVEWTSSWKAEAASTAIIAVQAGGGIRTAGRLSDRTSKREAADDSIFQTFCHLIAAGIARF